MLHMVMQSAMLVTAVCGHPIPDGAIYRGVQFVVRDDRIEIRYQLGLNDTMVQTELKRLSAESIPADATEALSLYRQLVLYDLTKHITVRIDGHPQAIQPLRADIVRQHHAAIECAYEVAIQPTTTPAKLEIRDDNFPEISGDHQFALRSRGRIEVLPTDVPLSLVRAMSDGESGAGVVPPPARKEIVQRRLTTYFCLPLQ
jgi:hypothetical protein